jgi:predicted TIM-barrel fold metal-dependent hydrolase
MNIIDIHPHIISDDLNRYPLAPLFGKRSEWSSERPTTVETLIAAMNESGVSKAAVVHSSTTYGFDNSYVLDGCNQYQDRLVAVCSVDMLDDHVEQTIDQLVKQGLVGLRVFTGGSTKDFDPSELENPKTFRVWEKLEQLKMSMCIQTGAVGIPQIRMLAKKFPHVNIIIDHLARPDILDGPPYAKASEMFALSEFPNIYLKLTPRIFGDVKKEKASPDTFFPQLIQAFGANHLAWGSNYPSSSGTLKSILAQAQDCLSCVSEQDREWIFSKTAQLLYPQLI